MCYSIVQNFWILWGWWSEISDWMFDFARCKAANNNNNIRPIWMKQPVNDAVIMLSFGCFTCLVWFVSAVSCVWVSPLPLPLQSLRVCDCAWPCVTCAAAADWPCDDIERSLRSQPVTVKERGDSTSCTRETQILTWILLLQNTTGYKQSFSSIKQGTDYAIWSKVLWNVCLASYRYLTLKEV